MYLLVCVVFQGLFISALVLSLMNETLLIVAYNSLFVSFHVMFSSQ